jgi:DNA-binding CsgD family transcriptional regulator
MLRIFSKLSIAVLLALLVQIFSASFFIFDILSSLFGFWTVPFDWQTREYLEIGAALGLLLGVIMGIVTLYHALWQQSRAEEQLRRASVAFMDLLEEQFAEWGLTPAERDVALFAIKGLSTAEIAALRSTSEGTVKAQTNAIYRKAGVSGRPQLLSLFIDELMQDAPMAQRLANAKSPVQAVQSAA